MEPAILDFARQAAAKVEAAGVRLDELRETIAFFFGNAEPDDPTEDAGDRRYTRRLIVSEVWRMLTLNARAFEATTGTVTANARLIGAFSRAVSAIERLGHLVEDQYESEAGPLLPTMFDLLGLRTKEELVMMLLERCELSPKEIAHLFVVGIDGQSWAPWYRPSRVGTDGGDAAAVKAKLHNAAGEVRQIKFRTTEHRREIEATRRTEIEHGRAVDLDAIRASARDRAPPWLIDVDEKPTRGRKVAAISGVTKRARKSRST